MYLGSTTTTLTEEYLSEKYPMVELEENVMINASFLPNAVLAEMVSNLENQVIFRGEEVLHFRMKIKKKWISIRMKLLSSTRIV
jgi:hypothetical protein